MKQFIRLNNIPPYHFASLDRIKSEIQQKGFEIADLSIGDPDLPTPEFIVEAMKEGLSDSKNFKYPPYDGTIEFKKAVADYYKRRMGVTLNPENEVIALIGSKEGIAHLSLAVIDRGDIALIPDPAYPVYKTSTLIAGGCPYTMPLTEKNGFIPDVSSISSDTSNKAKVMYMNYPNNPTGAVCDEDIFQDVVEFARKYNIIVCNDAAYNEIVFDGRKPASILSVDGARDVAVELGTLSKSYNMTGWRIGYAVGNEEILKKIMVIKNNTDSGQFTAIQYAASIALSFGDHYIDYIRWVYEKRRDNAVKVFREIGLNPIVPKGSFYIWFKVPDGFTSYEFASKLTQEYGIIITPGRAFGIYGEGYCRIALTLNEEQLKTVIHRIKKSFKKQS